MNQPTQASQLSNRLFTRLYVVLVLTLIIIGSGLEYILNRMDEADLIEDTKQLKQPVFALISEQLLAQDEASWSEHLAELQVHFTQPLWLMSLNDFAADEATLQLLNEGAVLELFDVDDQLTLYQRVGQTNAVLGMTTEIPESTDQRAWVLPVFYALLALVLYGLIRPFARQLLQLKQASVDLGSGDFSARVEVPASTTLAPIADAFNAMTKKIESLMHTQRDLVNAVSHELRTPLARLKFGFEALQDSTDQQQLDQVVAAMRTDVSELELLIDEMLRYAEVNQIEAYKNQPINIKALLEGLVAAHQNTDIQVSLDLDDQIDADAVINCDEMSINRALSNIVRNGISFAKHDLLISAFKQDQSLVIDICDDGVGLDGVNVTRIFEPFYKVKNQKRKAGYGLGLSIAKTIIKKHHGQLEVVTGQLPGACFRCFLPLR